MRTDIVKVYKAVHTWVGVIAALFLFIAFYCGAITMFKEPLAHWSAPASGLPPAPSLEEAPGLVGLVLQAHPEARGSYTVHLELSRTSPARVTWALRNPAGGHHDEPRIFGASLDSSGGLVVKELISSPVSRLVDTLHRQVGLPIDEHVALPLAGAISLLYFLALVSGVVILLPTLGKSLFQLRAGARSVRRFWLDAHNALGFLSLPFHFVIAFTALVFAFHDEFYALQDKVLYSGRMERPARTGSPSVKKDADGGQMLTPVELRERLAAQAPDFHLLRIEYFRSPSGALGARVFGDDVRHMLRGPTFGLGTVDPRTGALISTDYFPGRQPADLALVTAFFSLHFGNFGGTPIRWIYVALGLSGAFLFYSGNLLWLEARRKRSSETSAGPVLQPRSTRFLASLTVGVCLGTISGVSLTIAAARWLPLSPDLELWHTLIYCAAFAGSVAWAFARGAGRASFELLWLCVACTVVIPLGTVLCLLTGLGLPPSGPFIIDWVALAGAVVFAGLAHKTRRRALYGSPDSVWSAAVR